MILVLLGTNDKKFNRLLEAIDKQIKNGNIKEKVIVQAGCTKYESNNMEIFDLMEKEKLDELVKKSDIIITHGGVGSILQGLDHKKIVIAAARLKKYEEVSNDHQIQIIKEFTKRGYILELSDFDKLDEVLKKAKTFKPKSYKSNNKNFVRKLDNYIEETNNISWYNKYRNIIYCGFPGLIMSFINILIFDFLNYNLLLNIVVSFLITFALSLIINKIIDIKLNKNYIITKIFNLILDILFMYMLVNILSINVITSKVITNIIICILIFTIIKVSKKR